MHTKFHTGLRGHFDLYLNGKKVHETANTILDVGLDLYATLTISNLLEACYIGDGNSDVEITDITLDNPTNKIIEDITYESRDAVAFTNNTLLYKRRYEFTPTSETTIREIGVGPDENIASAQLFSRILYLERFEQSEIVVRSYETLTIIYSLFEEFQPESPAVITTPFFGRDLNFELRSSVESLYGQVFNGTNNNIQRTDFGIFHPARDLKLYFYSANTIPVATQGLNRVTANSFFRQQDPTEIRRSRNSKLLIYNWPENFDFEEDFARIGRVALGLQQLTNIDMGFVMSFTEDIIKFFFSNVTFIIEQSWGRST